MSNNRFTKIKDPMFLGTFEARLGYKENLLEFVKAQGIEISETQTFSFEVRGSHLKPNSISITIWGHEKGSGIENTSKVIDADIYPEQFTKFFTEFRIAVKPDENGFYG